MNYSQLMHSQLLYNRNEVLQGPSPKCVQVLRSFSPRNLSRYFEGYFGSLLIPALSKKFLIPEQHIMLGYGLEDVLRIVFNRLKSGTDTLLTHDPHFTYYDKYLRFRGVTVESFGMIEAQHAFVYDISDCLKKIDAVRPTVVLITSPNNPTGNSISVEDLSRVLRRAKRSTLVVLDEAYFGFDERYGQQAFIGLLKKHPNFMILRSFSKQYALAGLRMGYALCGKDVKKLLQFQNYYLGGSRLLEEVAVAAMSDVQYYKKLSHEIISDRKRFIASVNTLKNFRAFDSNANFVYVKANTIVLAKLKKGLEHEEALISKFVTEACMRVTIGSKRYTDAFLKLLRETD